MLLLKQSPASREEEVRDRTLHAPQPCMAQASAHSHRRRKFVHHGKRVCLTWTVHHSCGVGTRMRCWNESPCFLDDCLQHTRPGPRMAHVCAARIDVYGAAAL
jgi:hypothetical protein